MAWLLRIACWACGRDTETVITARVPKWVECEHCHERIET